MSLTKEGFEAAVKLNRSLNERVNKLLKKLELNLLDKVQMDHYGSSYLFGNKIKEQTTDQELIDIIKSTPKEDYNGHITFFGEFTTGSK